MLKIKKTAGGLLRKMKIKEELVKPHNIDDNKPVVFYAFLEKMITISEIEEGGMELPNSLVISKGKYAFGGENFSLDKEGLYRFVFPGKENQQRIVFQDDLDALLSSIAWIFAHGNKDDGRNYEEILDKTKNTKIFLTCGSISEWVVKFLENQGVKARTVATLTLENWNSYDNGHILIEVFKKELNKWVLYDIDNDAYFTKNNDALSLIEFSECVMNGDYEVNFIAKKNDVDTSNFIDKENSYDFNFLIEARFLNHGTRKEWYKRVFQVPMIVHDGFSYFFDSENKDRILTYSSFYKFLEKEKFLNKFYG